MLFFCGARPPFLWSQRETNRKTNPKTHLLPSDLNSRPEMRRSPTEMLEVLAQAFRITTQAPRFGWGRSWVPKWTRYLVEHLKKRHPKENRTGDCGSACVPFFVGPV